MNFEVINPLEDPEWDDFVASHPKVSVFHTAFWARLLAETYGYKPAYLVQKKNGSLRAALPVMEIRGIFGGRRAVSLPFTDYCDPLFADDVDGQEVFQEILAYGRNVSWRSLEIRERGTPSVASPASSTFLGHVLDLVPDEAALMKKFRGSTQRNIKKATAAGVTVTLSCTDAAMDDFYRLNCLTRREHGLPPQPSGFFKRLARSLRSGNHGFVALASVRGEAIAGGVFLQFRNRAAYKYGASDKRFHGMRANNLLMWEAIRHYAACGGKTFCFGRTEEGNEGLRQFKDGWGGKEQAIDYLKYDFGSSAFVKRPLRVKGFHNAVFRGLPLPISRVIGETIYKHMA